MCAIFEDLGVQRYLIIFFLFHPMVSSELKIEDDIDRAVERLFRKAYYSCESYYVGYFKTLKIVTVWSWFFWSKFITFRERICKNCPT